MPKLKKFRTVVYFLMGLFANFFFADFAWPTQKIDPIHIPPDCESNLVNASGDHFSIVCSSGDIVFEFQPVTKSSATLLPYLLIGISFVGLVIIAYPKTRKWFIGRFLKTSKDKIGQRSNVLLNSVFVKILPEEFQGELIALTHQEIAKGTPLFRINIIIWSELIPLIYELALIKLRTFIRANSKSQGIDD